MQAQGAGRAGLCCVWLQNSERPPPWVQTQLQPLEWQGSVAHTVNVNLAKVTMSVSSVAGVIVTELPAVGGFNTDSEADTRVSQTTENDLLNIITDTQGDIPSIITDTQGDAPSIITDTHGDVPSIITHTG